MALSDMMLRHCGLVTPNGGIDLRLFWLKLRLGACGTKPLPEPMLSHHEFGSVACTQEQFRRECSRIQAVT